MQITRIVFYRLLSAFSLCADTTENLEGLHSQDLKQSLGASRARFAKESRASRKNKKSLGPVVNKSESPVDFRNLCSLFALGTCSKVLLGSLAIGLMEDLARLFV